MVELRMKRDEILDARAAKKGGIDMEKFYPGNSDPEEVGMFSRLRKIYLFLVSYNTVTDLPRPPTSVSDPARVSLAEL